MREQKCGSGRSYRQRPSIISRRLRWNSLSAIIRKCQRILVSNFHSYDWNSRTQQSSIFITELQYRITITVASTATFGAGLGEIIAKLLGG